MPTTPKCSYRFMLGINFEYSYNDTINILLFNIYFFYQVTSNLSLNDDIRCFCFVSLFELSAMLLSVHFIWNAEPDTKVSKVIVLHLEFFI